MNQEQYKELLSQIFALRVTLTTLITTLDKDKAPFSANLLYSHLNVLRDRIEVAAETTGSAKLLE
ncbi:MAG: hypothetical protein D6801_00210, partial [Alphaproteobacteria bacterium]